MYKTEWLNSSHLLRSGRTDTSLFILSTRPHTVAISRPSTT